VTELEDVLGKVCAQLRDLPPDDLWQAGDFPVDVARLLSDAGLTRLCLPRQAGGAGGSLTDLVTAVEQVSRADASTGWCLFILATAPWLLCHARPELIAEVYADPATRVAGALAPTGTLRPHGDDFLLNGRWTFGSALNASDWVAVHAVFEGAEPARSAFAVLPTAAVTYREPWDGMGLAASGSGPFGVSDVVVPAGRLIPGLSGTPVWPDPVLRVPFRATFAACAAVLLGIAGEMLDVFVDHARRKRPTYGSGVLGEQPQVRQLVAESWAGIASARSLLYDAVEAVTETPDLRRQAELRIAMNNVRQSTLDVVGRLHLAAGGGAALRESRFAVLLRDAHTASQHHMFSTEIGALAGGVLLGYEMGEGQL
jgi:alkylation response protein AidB-like acyl-CoA dehydrogenase